MRNLIFISLLVSNIILAQELKLGGTFSIAIPGKNIEAQGGIGPNLEFSMSSLPFAVQAGLSFQSARADVGFKHASLGARVLYFPFDFSTYTVRIYLGAGIYQNYYTVTGTDHVFVSITKIEDNISAELAIGFILNPKSNSTNWFVEYAYALNKTDMEYHKLSVYDQITRRGKFNLNSSYVKVGVMFIL